MIRFFKSRLAAAPNASRQFSLGSLELEVMQILWAGGESSVRDVFASMKRPLAYTTVMTTLDRLFKKDLLTREAEGRAFRYKPRFSREELHREVAGQAFRQLLDASPAATLPLSYLVEILTQRDAQLLDDLSDLIEVKRKQLRDGSRSERPAKNPKEDQQ